MLVHEAAAVLLVGNVGCDGMGSERLRRDLDLRTRPGGERQGEAVLVQHARDREANTRRAACDECRPAHAAIFSSRKVQRRPCRTGRGGTERLLLSPESHGGTTMVPPWPILWTGGNRTGPRLVTTVNRSQSVDERLTDPYISRFNPREGCFGHRNRARQTHRPRLVRRVRREVFGGPSRATACRLRSGGGGEPARRPGARR